MCRLKPDGFPLISQVLDKKPLGTNGEWFDAGLEIQFICDPDFQTLQDNYELSDDFAINETLYYPSKPINGKEKFQSLVNSIYNGRKQYKGKAKARFYKTLNEILPGYFEKTQYDFGFYKKDFQKTLTPSQRYNPKIGIFITAYGRQMLNDLLHMFPHDRVIGYDTDCVFFAGTKNALPYQVRCIMGDDPGQVHEDGYYRDVYHKASKSY